MDQLPSWMIEAIALLDAASPGEVEGLGRKVGEITYWIELDQLPSWMIEAKVNQAMMQRTIDELQMQMRTNEKTT